MNRAKVVCMLIGLFAAAVSATGCASSSSYKQAGKTSDQMGVLRAELEKGKTQIDSTVTALNAISSASNLPAAFEAYRKELKAMESQAERVRKRADDMRKKGADYFKAWEKQLEQLSSEELRRRASERRTELVAAFEGISEASQALKDAYGPFMVDLTDIDTFLATDLSPQSIGLISDTIKKAAKDGTVVIRRIDDVIKEIDDTVRKFGGGAAPA